MQPSRATLLALTLPLTIGMAFARDLRVPQDYPAIQDAIDAAPPGATIVVASGTYYENLYIQRSIHLVAATDASQTVIDGQHIGPVIVAQGTGSEIVEIRGFSVINGLNTFEMVGTGVAAGMAGGIHVESVVARLSDNLVRDNVGCLGVGISTLTAKARIQRNDVVDNAQHSSCYGADGGGIFLRADGIGPSVVEDNFVARNSIGGSGAGMAFQGMNGATVRDNVIRENHSDQGIGGGILMNVSDGVVSDNFLVGNTATTGGAMQLLPIDNANRLLVRGNVMIGNDATNSGSSVELGVSTRHGLRLLNNVITGNSPVALVSCQVPFRISPSNALYNAGGELVTPFCDY